MAETKASAGPQKPETRVVQWVGFKPGDTELTSSHTLTVDDLRKAVGPDYSGPELVFEREKGFFIEVPVSEVELLAFLADSKTVGFVVKPVKSA